MDRRKFLATTAAIAGMTALPVMADAGRPSTEDVWVSAVTKTIPRFDTNTTPYVMHSTFPKELVHDGIAMVNDRPLSLSFLWSTVAINSLGEIIGKSSMKDYQFISDGDLLGDIADQFTTMCLPLGPHQWFNNNHTAYVSVADDGVLLWYGTPQEHCRDAACGRFVVVRGPVALSGDQLMINQQPETYFHRMVFDASSIDMSAFRAASAHYGFTVVT